MTDKHKLSVTILEAIEKFFGGSAKDERHVEGEQYKDNIPVSKSVDTELKQATFLVLAPEEVDLHGDIYSEEEIRKGCHNYNVHCQKANLFHLAETQLANVVESYITPAEMYLGDRLIKKGSWLQVYQFEDDDLWALVKSGDINGVSIGCLGHGEQLDD